MVKKDSSLVNKTANTFKDTLKKSRTAGKRQKKAPNPKSSKEIYFFSFHPGTSFLHRIPATAKLIFIPFFSAAIFFLPSQFAVSLVVIQFFIAKIAGISFKEQIKDLKPIFLYVIIMEIFQLIILVNQNISFFTEIFFASIDVSRGRGLDIIRENGLDIFRENGLDFLRKQGFDFSTFSQGQKTLLLLFSRLLALIQCSSLLYKTSSSLQIREGIEKIESAIRKLPGLKKQNRFSDSLFMFINFIPMLSRIFSDLQKAWLARGGKKNLKMYAALFPILFSLGMKKAWSLTRAIQIRSTENQK